MNNSVLTYLSAFYFELYTCPRCYYRLEEEPIMQILYMAKLHAFGSNSTESEPIWMKSGTG